MASATRTETTYHYELWRAGAGGVLESAGTTFLLLIALRWFGAGAWSKAFVAAGGSLGLLLTPVVVGWATRAGIETSKGASRITAFGACMFLLAAAVPILPMYVVCVVLAMASSAAVIPLLTHMYEENYPEKQRGRLFSRTVMIRIASACLFSWGAGKALTVHLEWFRILLVVFAAALGFASFCLSRCPTSAIAKDEMTHPFRSLRFIRDDAIFRRTLICWMLMGFANLMMLPLRVEYLGNPRYNQKLAVGAVALLTSVVPNLARLVLSPIWGYLFDQMNFFALRVTVNLGFAIGILAFFTSNTMPGLIFGAVVFGISNAGGDVAWSLWVTKFAPPGRVADYMSIHTCLTGLRGVLAPLVAFYFVSPSSLGTLAMVSTGMILLSILMLLPEMKWGKRARPGTALVEEVSE